MTEFKELKLSELVASATNPRSEFEENSLNELAESIKSHGVLQPIIVRVHPEENKKFEVVCGERRYRASKIAKMKTIPVSVRELTDDEVFEIQIVENLERKDVHPLDEAIAFRRMLDSGKYSMEDIAAKVAKTLTFVAQRLKLNDLIPELKEEFLKGEFGIGHAVLLARVSNEKQSEIFEQSKDKWEPGYGTVKQLKEDLEDDDLDLANAFFNLEDPTIFVGAGPCSTCPKNSRANAVLFPEYEDNICFDKTCYETKTEVSKRAAIKKIIDENPGLIFTCRYPDSSTKAVFSFVETFGKKVLTGWDSYTNSVESNEKAVRSFDLDRWDFQFIIIRDLGNDASGASDDPSKNLKREISNIKDRAARALELDREKIYIRAINEIKKDDERNNKMLTSEPLEVCEKKALALAILSYQDDNWIKKDYGVKIGYMNRHEQLDKIFSDKFLNKLIRHHIQRELITESLADFERLDKPRYVHAIFSHYFPKEIELFTLEQTAIAEKRITKSNARIQVLQNEIDSKIDTVKRCTKCKKSDDDILEETGYPVIWREDLCLSCSTKV